MLGIAKKAKLLVSGEELTIEEIRKGNIYLVVLAEDAGKNTKKKIENKCNYYKINLIIDFSIKEISKSINSNNRTVVGIKDKGLSNSIIKIRGELYGKKK